jgi:hypothetical protein
VWEKIATRNKTFRKKACRSHISLPKYMDMWLRSIVDLTLRRATKPLWKFRGHNLWGEVVLVLDIPLAPWTFIHIILSPEENECLNKMHRKICTYIGPRRSWSGRICCYVLLTSPRSYQNSSHQRKIDTDAHLYNWTDCVSEIGLTFKTTTCCTLMRGLGFWLFEGDGPMIAFLLASWLIRVTGIIPKDKGTSRTKSPTYY